MGGGRGIPRWTLSATGVQEQFTGQIEHLIHVGRAVAGIKEVRWRSDRRRGPIADRESLAMMFEAVLTSANTSLTVRELARVAAARFNLLDPPLLVDVDDALSGPVAPVRDGPAQTIIAAETAADLWSQLTDRERDVTHTWICGPSSGSVSKPWKEPGGGGPGQAKGAASQGIE